MDRRNFLNAVAAGAAGTLVAPRLLTAAPPDKKQTDVESAVERGLEWLKKTQAPDGHWDSPGGMYPTTMTAVAGMAFLMEGSTLREGKYSEQIEKAFKWFTGPNKIQANGLLGDMRNASELGRYMYGHGFGTMFLANVLGEEEDNQQRKKLESVLKKCVEFIGKAQSQKKHRKVEGKEMDIGGWYYWSSADAQFMGSSNMDEGSVTVTQLQALRACKNAGIPVPIEIINKAVNYLEACTTAQGGVIYSYANSGGAAASGQERPPLTAAALACAISSGEFANAIQVMNRKDPPPPTGINRPNVVRWLEYCKKAIPITKVRQNHEEYQMYYFSQAMYMLGEERYGQLFPNDPKESWMTWSKYKENWFPYLLETQDKASGGWQGTGGYGCGPVFITGVNLCTLQLEKALIPIYQR